MKRLKKSLPWLALFFLILLVFRNWFSGGEIAAKDAPLYFQENLREFSWQPSLWSNLGLGQYQPLLFSFFYLVFLPKSLFWLHLPWELIERLAWYAPFLLFSLWGAYYLYKTVWPKSAWGFLASLIYSTNTFILMIIGGGQVSIALAYSLAPLVLALFFQVIKQRRRPRQIGAGLAFALQVVFEPRIAFLTGFIVFFYALYQFRWKLTEYCKAFWLPLLISLGVHFYWLLPLFLLKRPPFPSEFSASGWVGFLSFADFSKSLALLHPNWPENIFGKTYFFRPEFLLLPILAFSALLFSQRIKNLVQKKNLLFFASLGLMGAFLAKGTNPPFGEVYLWLFKNVPGMNLFRDASKFYLLTALSYSILIPFSLSEIHKRLSTKNLLFSTKNYLTRIFLLLVFCYLLLLIKPAIGGELNGTFKTKKIPHDYLVLKEFLISQPEFFRTFWVPKQQRFGFHSNNHPVISSESFSTDTVCLEPFCSLRVEMPENWGEKCFPNDRCYVRELSFFLNPQTEKVLAAMAIKYIIVPFDSEGEIFMAERQYNHQQREEVETFLETIAWLEKVEVTEKIAVYQVSDYQDHFFLADASVVKSIKMINPTKYLVSLEIDQPPATLVFSETYDELWQMKIDGETISSQLYLGFLNSFFIEQTGDLEVMVEFSGQQYVYWGGIVSLLTLLLSGGYLVFSFRQRKA